MAANMILVINVADKKGDMKLSPPPDHYPICGSAARYDAVKRRTWNRLDKQSTSLMVMAVFVGSFLLLALGFRIGRSSVHPSHRNKFNDRPRYSTGDISLPEMSANSAPKRLSLNLESLGKTLSKKIESLTPSRSRSSKIGKRSESQTELAPSNGEA